MGQATSTACWQNRMQLRAAVCICVWTARPKLPKISACTAGVVDITLYVVGGASLIPNLAAFLSLLLLP